jgi:hypothetical protein
MSAPVRRLGVSSGLVGGSRLAVSPGGGFAVGGVVAEAAVQDADERSYLGNYRESTTNVL